jgi:hypothetical protein
VRAELTKESERAPEERGTVTADLVQGGIDVDAMDRQFLRQCKGRRVRLQRALSPALIADFVRIRAGEKIVTNPNATSQFYTRSA